MIMSTGSIEASPSPSPGSFPSTTTITLHNSFPKMGTLIPNRVFVGGISTSTTESELHQLFSEFGNVKQTKIIADRSGVSKGYGFVTFETEEEARRLQAASEDIILKERKLNIAPAIKKQPNYTTSGGRGYEMGQPIVNGAVYYHNGIPYTYQNGVAMFITGDPNAINGLLSPTSQKGGVSPYPVVYPAGAATTTTMFIPSPAAAAVAAQQPAASQIISQQTQQHQIQLQTAAAAATGQAVRDIAQSPVGCGAQMQQNKVATPGSGGGGGAGWRFASSTATPAGTPGTPAGTPTQTAAINQTISIPAQGMPSTIDSRPQLSYNNNNQELSTMDKHCSGINNNIPIDNNASTNNITSQNTFTNNVSDNKDVLNNNALDNNNSSNNTTTENNSVCNSNKASNKNAGQALNQYPNNETMGAPSNLPGINKESNLDDKSGMNISSGGTDPSLTAESVFQFEHKSAADENTSPPENSVTCNSDNSPSQSNRRDCDTPAPKKEETKEGEMKPDGVVAGEAIDQVEDQKPNHPKVHAPTHFLYPPPQVVYKGESATSSTANQNATTMWQLGAGPYSTQPVLIPCQPSHLPAYLGFHPTIQPQPGAYLQVMPGYGGQMPQQLDNMLPNQGAPTPAAACESPVVTGAPMSYYQLAGFPTVASLPVAGGYPVALGSNYASPDSLQPGLPVSTIPINPGYVAMNLPESSTPALLPAFSCDPKYMIVSGMPSGNGSDEGSHLSETFTSANTTTPQPQQKEKETNSEQTKSGTENVADNQHESTGSVMSPVNIQQPVIGYSQQPSETNAKLPGIDVQWPGFNMGNVGPAVGCLQPMMGGGGGYYPMGSSYQPLPAGLPPLTPITPSVEPVEGSKTGLIVPHTPNTMTNTQFHFNYIQSPPGSVGQTRSSSLHSPESAHHFVGGEDNVLPKHAVRDKSRLNSPFKQFVSYTGHPIRNRFPLQPAPVGKYFGGRGRRPVFPPPFSGPRKQGHLPPPRYSQGRWNSGFGAPRFLAGPEVRSRPPAALPHGAAPGPRKITRRQSYSKDGFYQAGDVFGKRKDPSMAYNTTNNTNNNNNPDQGGPQSRQIQRSLDSERSAERFDQKNIDLVRDAKEGGAVERPGDVGNVEGDLTPPPTPANLSATLLKSPDLLQGQMRKLHF